MDDSLFGGWIPHWLTGEGSSTRWMEGWFTGSLDEGLTGSVGGWFIGSVEE